MYEWLYENETFKQKYRRREDFFGEVEDHMKSINFSPDKPLNIKKRKIQHPYMQEYNKILRQLNEEI
ncbi:MAG: hypothetical protein H6765_05870 [Candidatus Peribacteria bacterium]|nr:MAG: hypothetical protein H6765_05870 [Candidatus Peribacteria bacterium]